jgi:AcrR family transcriptional regulator
VVKKSGKSSTDPNAKEKIKDTARILFHQKGFSGTRTRDIVETANINLDLLNYYFRSKEKLFRLIMTEDAQVFIQILP